MELHENFSATSIFAKTSKGREEMVKRSFGLSPLQRRVLIIIDGLKDLNAIAEMMPAVIPAHQRDEVLGFLLENGFIECINPAAPAVAAAVQAQAAYANAARAVAVHGAMTLKLTEDPSVLRAVKDFMTITAHTYLGLLGAGVIQRVEHAKTAEQLMAVVGQWHMALHESIQGRRFAAPYLEQVRQALTGNSVVLGQMAPQAAEV